jgi:uncharacterized protein (TIGR02145 family)
MNKKVTVATLGIAAFSSSIFCSAFAEPVTRNTEFSVTVNPYLNVTLSSNDVHLPITPSSGGTFGSTYFTASASTNNALGYSLNLSIKDTNTAAAVLTTDLTSDTINVNDGTKPVIPTFSTNDILTNAQFSASTSADHLNHWAMSLDDTDHYQKVLSESTIATSDEPIADDVTTLNLATKLDLLTPPGSYSAYFNFEIVANIDDSSKGTEGGSIGEDGGGNAGRVFPANSLLRAFELAYNNAGKSIYVEDSSATEVPGWRPMTDEDQATIGGKEVRFAIQDIVMTFEENNVTHGVCEWAQSSSADNSYMDTALVMDLRDGTSYDIIKGADGRCWLADNLALDLTDSTVLNNVNETNTNASATAIGYLKGTSTRNPSTDPDGGYATAGVANLNSAPSYSEPLIDKTAKNLTKGTMSNPEDTLSAADSWKFGIYYNYCAASAGSYCYGNGANVVGVGLDKQSTAIDAEYDICPSGWRMPTGSNYDATDRPDGGEYQSLAYAMTGATTTFGGEPAYSNYRIALRLPLSGDTADTSVVAQGSFGFFWSSTIDGNGSMYFLNANSIGGIAPQSNSFSRYGGQSVRCINKN